MSKRPPLNAPDTFCWVECACEDLGKTKKFYKKLLGWDYRDDAVPGGATYSMAFLDDGAICGLYELSDEMREAGMYPKWTSYIACSNIVATVERAQSLGGEILADATEIGTAGRMAIVADPLGAIFGLWQGKDHPGGGLAHDTAGSFGWHELLTTDTVAASEFYSKLFHWKVDQKSFDELSYTEFLKDGKPVCGMMQLTADLDDVPPNWMIYFNVNDCSATVSAARKNGSRVLFPPEEYTEVGNLAVLEDPGNAIFSVMNAKRD